MGAGLRRDGVQGVGRRARAQGGGRSKARARTPLKEKLGRWPPEKRLSPSSSSSLDAIDLRPLTIGGAKPGGAKPGGTPVAEGGSGGFEEEEEACAISRR